MEDILDSRVIADVIVKAAGVDDRVVVCEIGGYCAGALSTVFTSLGHRFAGVVEDTEAGHRRYESLERVEVPVVSAARSPLKEAEDRLIGASVAFSIERQIRSRGRTLVGMKTLVLGYGKIGFGSATALRSRGAQVAVWDESAVQRVRAVSDGYPVPERSAALRDAELIVGATGVASVQRDDFQILRGGAILASASSKQVEFELPPARRVDPHGVLVVERGDLGDVRVLAGGHPVNFVDGAVVGPALRLVQAELLAATAAVAAGGLSPGLAEVDSDTRRWLAELWLENHVDPTTGLFRQD
jgi:adenosylhomocysteinase